MNTETLVALIVVLAGAGGIAGAVLAWRKAGPERGNIIVSGSLELVGSYREEFQRLDRERDQLREYVETIKHELGNKIEALEREREELRRENARLVEENRVLAGRVKHLEDDLAALRVNGGATGLSSGPEG